jgi:predicted CXXCH cytochrome family protein
MKTILSIILAFLTLTPAIALAIHDDPGGAKCLDCHVTLPFDREKLSYTEKVGEICRHCHSKYPCNNSDNQNSFAHPIEVTASMEIPVDMPVDAKDRITCITCHSYHAEFWDAEYNSEFLLRRPKGKKLCATCHKDFPKI